ncbi:sporulation membrane protein YtrI [Pontibacillus salicampi]|uniref:Sporulation membrane protein YtrI n=1 Tax=Pontibacillus salicampi TaxID=1449801 RepID=A0ABV6LJ64_9BACI
MHIPPYYKRRDWQRFLAGVFIGGIIAYACFLFMYGTYVENWIEKNLELHEKIRDLESTNEMLIQDKEELNKKQKDIIQVHAVDIQFSNEKKLIEQHSIDKLTVFNLRRLVKEQTPDLIGQDTNSLYDNASLIYRAIEARTYKVDDLKYEMKVERLLISQNVSITIRIVPVPG